MKYLSLIAVIVFIGFTAWFSQKTEQLTIDQMNKMNNLIQQYMTQAVRNHNPNIEEIDFSRVDTEVIESGKKMKANFSFSYTEPNENGEMEKVYRKGSFLITSEDGQKWTAQIEQAGDVKVEFLEPFEITDDGVEPIDAGGAEEEVPLEGNSDGASPDESAEAETPEEN